MTCWTGSDMYMERERGGGGEEGLTRKSVGNGEDVRVRLRCVKY